MMNRTGHLKRLNPEDVWLQDEDGFRNWINQNLPTLSDVLGLDLELRVTTDHYLVALDLNSDQKVVIEGTPKTPHDWGTTASFARDHKALLVVCFATPNHWRETYSDIDQADEMWAGLLGVYWVLVDYLKVDDSRPAISLSPVRYTEPNSF